MTDHDRRPTSTDRWELWNLRALQPHATFATLAALRARRRELEARGDEVFVHGADAPRLVDDARAFFRAHPGIHSGLVLSLHLGPYSLLPALYLAEGIEPVLVTDGAARDRLQAEAEQRQKTLGLSGSIEWVGTDRPVFAGRILKALRTGRPVLVYLDGNGGGGGMEATRDRGMPYRLPGRTIRVRTGPGRLIKRTGCPVHGVAVRWRRDGTLAWTARRPGCWDTAATSRQITRQLHDWLFDEIARSPEQWTFWNMLARAGDAFSPVGLEEGPGPDDRERLWREFAGARADRPSATRLALTCGAEVWEPDVLADPGGDRFWSAEGLRDSTLDLFRDGAAPSLAELSDACGDEWVDFHGLRLVLLGILEMKTAS